MANRITPLNFANTFGDWVSVTNQVVAEANTFGFQNYTKNTGTFFIQSPGVGLQVSNNATVSGQLSVFGSNVSLIVQNDATVGGSVNANTIVVGNLVVLGNTTSSGTTLYDSNEFLLKGISGVSAPDDGYFGVKRVGQPTAYIKFDTTSKTWSLRDVGGSDVEAYYNIVTEKYTANTSYAGLVQLSDTYAAPNATLALSITGAYTISQQLNSTANSLQEQISSNVSSINQTISENAVSANSVINTRISANVAMLRGEITSNISTLTTNTIANTNALAAQTANLAAQTANAVYITGNQSITGIKTFSTAGGIRFNAPVLVRQDTGGEGGQIDFQRASDGLTHYYLDVSGTGTTPIFRLVNAPRSAQTWSIDNSGNMTAEGNVTAYSDIRLKTDLTKIADALDKISKLNGYTYTRTDSGARQTGLIAQELQQVLPEAVMDDGQTLSIAYGNLAGLLVEAIKELTERLEALEKK